MLWSVSEDHHLILLFYGIKSEFNHTFADRIFLAEYRIYSALGRNILREPNKDIVGTKIKVGPFFSNFEQR